MPPRLPRSKWLHATRRRHIGNSGSPHPARETVAARLPLRQPRRNIAFPRVWRPEAPRSGRRSTGPETVSGPADRRSGDLVPAATRPCGSRQRERDPLAHAARSRLNLYLSTTSLYISLPPLPHYPRHPDTAHTAREKSQNRDSLAVSAWDRRRPSTSSAPSRPRRTTGLPPAGAADRTRPCRRTRATTRTRPPGPAISAGSRCSPLAKAETSGSPGGDRVSSAAGSPGRMAVPLV